MSFAKKLKKIKNGIEKSSRKIALCVAGPSGNFVDDWWSEIPNVTIFGFSYGEKISSRFSFDYYEWKEQYDLISYLDSKTNTKCTYHKKYSKVVCTIEDAILAYCISRVIFMKKMFELKTSKLFDLVLFVDPSNKIFIPEHPVSLNRIYSDTHFHPHKRIISMKHDYFYGDSVSMNNACGIFEHLPLLQHRQVYKIYKNENQNEFSQTIPFANMLYYYFIMLKMRVQKYEL